MSWVQIILLVFLIVAVIGLVRAANDLGANPYQRERMHKELGLHFSQKTSLAQREAGMNIFGIAPSDRKRPFVFAILVIIFFAAYVWLQ